SDRLACALCEKGIERGTFVGILFDREVWAYVAENAVLKTGCAFVPFIPEYPDERIDFCMKDGEIPILLTTKALRVQRSGLANESYKMLTVEELFGVGSTGDIRADGAVNFTKVPVQDTDAAYCIYTSGTTGRPKGVVIEHRNIANYVHRNEKSLEIMNYAAPGRVCLALASFSFDVSVVEEFVPLCNGNSVVIATEREIHDPSALAALIRNTGADGMTCTPTYLLNLLDIPETAEAIKQMTFFDIGAEAFPAQLYDRLRALREDSVILNVYGPTECTMGCAAEEMTSSKVVTVGPPIANTYFYVSDTFGNELPVGLRGELIICGDQVGRGYVSLPDKTAAAFFRHNGMRAYHSGDLAAWTADGKIRIFGRVDNQIKLRGFRIELDEIENVMTEYPGIKTGAAEVRKSGGTDYLVGYYTAQADISQDELKQHMHSKLPEYMVPSVFVKMDSMPMTVSGKVDKKKLPTPDLTIFRAEYAAPETETEKKLCAAFARALNMPEEKYGALDDFYELGGDSLKTMVVMAEAEIEGLNAADIFRYRTPRAIASVVESTDRISIEQREDKARKVPHPLTPLQVQMIDVQLFKPVSTMWSNTHFLLRFPLSIDADKLCVAVNKALQNHPALSSAFSFNDDNELVQQYIPGLLPKVKIRDISIQTAATLPDVLVMPFDRILNACLCRVGVYRSPEYLYLFMDIHHLLLDGGSLGVLLGDIVNAYNGNELKKDCYFALLSEEEEKIAAGARKQDKQWFSEYYKDEIWCNNLDADHESKNINQAERMHRLSFNAGQVADAEKYWGVTHSVMAIAAALVALSRFTGKQHVMINWIFNNRLSPESENAVGMLIKNLPAAARMEEFRNIRELLASVKEQVAEGIAHSTYDFMTETYSSFLDDCMEVNLQLGINGDEMDELKPTLIEL
ncbi:MAG: amino acid adenylation domain-containing protein, partial [Oscillospiraceae bacterium]|nr:amino acid adenylation domain-containing protein [Oscillospiraceae bacterium]